MKTIEGQIKIVPLSVNRAWRGRRFKTPEYKSFEKKLFFMLPRVAVTKGMPLKISFLWGFSNMASDVDNPCKQTMDCMAKRFGFNDRDVMEINLKKQKVKKGEEFIQFKIEDL